MTLEDKISAYKELRRKIDEMEEQKKLLITEILQLMPTHTKTVCIDDYRVSRYVRYSVRTSLETAKLFDATKIEEGVDKKRLKQLFLLGHPIPDVSQSEFITVTKIKEPALSETAADL